PIVTIAGHVDHGKTSILDCFRGSNIQEGEAGGITQKISFTKYPLEQIKTACPLIQKNNIALEIPGFLFIDTPGHAAFTNLRKRGGSLADLAILVVSIKEGIKPQTAEVIQILKANKTPFVIALNKLDSISSWRFNQNLPLSESIENQPINASNEFQESLLTFQSSLSEHGFESDLYFNISDFTKTIALVPCSARTKEGIPELILTLCGLCQKFLKERLELNEEAKGVILEVKKEKSQEYIEAILYDGIIEEGEEIAIANFDKIIVTKVRAIEEIEPLSFKYKNVKKAKAATGVRLHLTNKENILPGMLFQEINDNLDQIKETFKKELSKAVNLDKEGIIIKADSLGSLEALITLLKQENITIVKAGIGPISKQDLISAKANLDIDPLNAVILGFNVSLEEELENPNIKIIKNEVIFKLIDDLKVWRKNKQEEIERERLLSLVPISKVEILKQYVFKNSNPAVFGVKIISGKLKSGAHIIDDSGEEIAKLKSIQHEKESRNEALEGQEVAIALPGLYFDRHLKDKKFLYTDLSEQNFKKLKKNKDLLSSSELKTLQEIADIKQRKNPNWGM
ncbi:MAG: translation initiation factor IF-2, partial [Nanoarchaeota archaeon]